MAHQGSADLLEPGFRAKMGVHVQRGQVEARLGTEGVFFDVLLPSQEGFYV